MNLMQCKDIPEQPVLVFLLSRHYGRGATWFGPTERGDLPDNSVLRAMPEGIPSKLALAKMKAMIRKGLVDGCDCGCRGDFEITDKGKAMLDQAAA